MSAFDRFNPDAMMPSAASSSGSSTKIIIIVVALVVAVVAAVGIGFLIWWLVRKYRTPSTPTVSAKVTPTFNRKINVYQHQDTPSSPVPTGVYVKYGLAASSVANPSPSDLTFVAISDPVFILGKSPATAPPVAPTQPNANVSFTITAQNKNIKYLTIGVQDSTTVGGVYSQWSIMKTVANAGVAISFTEGLESYITAGAYSAEAPEEYTEALSESLFVYLSRVYHNLNTTDSQQMIVYDTDGTEITPV